MVHFGGRSLAIRAAVALCSWCALASQADAQTVSLQSPQSQVGFTGGVSIDPEQVFAGVFWETPEIGNHFHLRPGIEGGFGGDVSLATINVDFIAKFRLGASNWSFIQGGGPAIVIARFDGFGGERDTDIGAGGSYILGFAHDTGFLGEFRISAGGNVPSLKLAAGYGVRF